jgi:phosphoribosylformylglycinamidine synthase
MLTGALAPLDLELERRVQAAVQAAVAAGLVTAAHDCAEGGLAVALAEGGITAPASPTGCEVTLTAAGRPDLLLFGEGPSRVIVTVEPVRAREFEGLMAESAIPWRWLGTTGGDRVVIRREGVVLVDVELTRAEHAWRSGFERHMA